MANPFKEAEKAKKKAPGSKQETVEKKEVPQVKEAPVVEEKVQPAPVVETAAEKKEEKAVDRGEVKPQAEKTEKVVKEKDIFANLTPAKAAGKTTAFYLSEENINKLKKMAEKKGISVSKLLDHILSEVL